jgi:hypothetical protein
MGVDTEPSDKLWKVLVELEDYVERLIEQSPQQRIEIEKEPDNSIKALALKELLDYDTVTRGVKKHKIEIKREDLQKVIKEMKEGAIRPWSVLTNGARNA